MKLTDDQVDKILNKNPDAGDSLTVTFEDVEKFGNDDCIREMFTDINKYNRMLKEKITFINEALTAAIPFTRENLYLICAFTGSGKTTVAANISHPLWKQGKKTLVISNEESKQDILFRIGCLEKGYNFNEYKKGMMPPDRQKEVAILFQDISKFVKVLDVNYKDGLTTKLEGVKNALESIRTSDYSCAMIDYLQLIQYSVMDPTRGRYDVLNDFRIWLGRYIKNSNIPIVVFAQLHSIGKRQNKDLDSRIKEIPGIMEPATVILEVIPNFEEKTSDFIIQKDRFGLSGTKLTCAFDRGKLVALTEEHRQNMLQAKLDRIKGNATPLPGGVL